MKLLWVLLLLIRLWNGRSDAPYDEPPHRHRAQGRSLGDRIVGGSDADLGEYKFYVKLPGCGGSLIKPNIVLTAAHCVVDDDDDNIFPYYEPGVRVQVSLYELNDPSVGGAQEKEILAWPIYHPLYGRDGAIIYDYALILIEPVVGATVANGQLIDLNADEDKPEPGDLLSAIGMGLMDRLGGSEYPEFLQEVGDRPYITNPQCIQEANWIGTLDDSILCFSGIGRKSVCSGDSGGPAFDANTRQVGVASFVFSCANSKPSGFARVSRGIEWIINASCSLDSSLDWCPSGLPSTCGEPNPGLPVADLYDQNPTFSVTVGADGNPDTTYKFSGPEGATFFFSTCSATVDTALSVWENGNLALVACEDDSLCPSGVGQQSYIEFTIPSGASGANYFLRPGSHDGVAMSYDIEWLVWDAPTQSPTYAAQIPNTCGNAYPQAPVLDLYSRPEEISVTIDSSTGNPDYWYSFSAPEGSVFAFSTCLVTEDDTALSIWDSSILTQVACVDDSPCGGIGFYQSELIFVIPPGQSGTVYHLRPGSHDGNPTTYDIIWNVTLTTDAPSLVPTPAPSPVPSVAPSLVPTVAPTTAFPTSIPTVAPSSGCEPCYYDCERLGLRCGRRCDGNTTCEDECRSDYHSCTQTCDDTGCSEPPTVAPSHGTCGQVCNGECESAGWQCGGACNGDSGCEDSCRSQARQCMQGCPACPETDPPTVDACAVCDDQCRTDGRACGSACNGDTSCKDGCRTNARRCIQDCPCS